MGPAALGADCHSYGLRLLDDTAAAGGLDAPVCSLACAGGVAAVFAAQATSLARDTGERDIDAYIALYHSERYLRMYLPPARRVVVTAYVRDEQRRRAVVRLQAAARRMRACSRYIDLLFDSLASPGGGEGAPVPSAHVPSVTSPLLYTHHAPQWSWPHSSCVES